MIIAEKNKILTEKVIKQTIKNSACEYTDMILSRIKRGDINVSDADDLLFYLAEISDLDFLQKYKKEIYSAIKTIINIIRESMYEGDFRFLKYRGMFKGIGNLAVSFNVLHRKGFYLDNFNIFSRSVISNYFQENLNSFYTSAVCPHYYDSIYGVAGALNFALDNKPYDYEQIDSLLRYLVDLSFVDENGYIRFNIKEKPAYEESVQAPYVDFGMAHGILGPLFVLVKAKKHNCYIHGQNTAIINLLNLYKEYAICDDSGILSFPTQLQLNSNDNRGNYSFNCSWCYGNACILFTLFQIALFLNDVELYHTYKTSLEQLLRCKEKYNLEEPIVCHGLSSIVQIETIKQFMEGDFSDGRYSISLCENIYSTLEKHNNYSCQKGYLENYSFLEGSAGVILSLIQSTGSMLSGSKLLMLR